MVRKWGRRILNRGLIQIPWFLVGLVLFGMNVG
jgi:hypothetical protein